MIIIVRKVPGEPEVVYSLLFKLLLFKLMLYVRTEGHWTLLLLTMLGMVTAQGDELLANGATSVHFPLAVLGVGDNTLHLLARG